MKFSCSYPYNQLKTRIKICGITSLEDALVAIEAGADALGFVFYEKSPRYVSPEVVASIIQQLPPFVTTVGLFVNAEQAYIDTVLNKTGIDVIQLHGNETPGFCVEQIKPVIKAVPIANSADLKNIPLYPCSILLDAKAPAGVYGGTGETFDWSLLTNLEHKFPLILAGGLEPSNIQQALELRKWYAVDVSSGVEETKGIKSKHKIQLFCKKIHQFNGKV